MSDYLKAQDLLDDIRSVKNMRHEKYNFNGYFLGALYHRGHEVIRDYINGSKKINAKDARILEEYIYEMTRNRYGHLDRCGSEAMLRLQKEHGLSRKYRINRLRWKDKLRASLSPQLLPSVKKPKLKTGFKKIFNKSKKWLLAGTIVAAGIFGAKTLLKESRHPVRAEMSYTVTPDTATSASVIADTAVAVRAPTKENTSSQTADNKIDSIWKNYYDSALNIHLGSAGRDSLYQRVSSMIKEKRLAPDPAFSVSRYAHSITMWNLLRPNTAENKFIREAISGKTLSTEENRRFNNLIRQAGEKGKGLTGTGKFSNYDHSSLAAQKEHIHAVQTVNALLKKHTR